MRWISLVAVVLLILPVVSGQAYASSPGGIPTGVTVKQGRTYVSAEGVGIDSAFGPLVGFRYGLMNGVDVGLMGGGLYNFRSNQIQPHIGFDGQIMFTPRGSAVNLSASAGGGFLYGSPGALATLILSLNAQQFTPYIGANLGFREGFVAAVPIGLEYIVRNLGFTAEFEPGTWGILKGSAGVNVYF
ncbi:MAG: hypothetical protein ACUVXI_04960 [bacterium]